MPVPVLSEEQIAQIIQQVAEYIEQQRQTYRGSAVPPDLQRSKQRRFLWRLRFSLGLTGSVSLGDRREITGTPTNSSSSGFALTNSNSARTCKRNGR
jgi:hypothetical protein